jgi:hypothetical protein
MIPTVATIVVAKPRCSLRTSSLTSVMPAPSSPASPKPATKRSTAYWLNAVPSPIACSHPQVPSAGTSATNAFRMFATE